MQAVPRSRQPPPRSRDGRERHVGKGTCGTKTPVWARLLGANEHRSERRPAAMNYEGDTIIP